MNLAVLASAVLMIPVLYVPFLQDVFNVVPMGWEEWRVIIPLFMITSIAAEAVKYYITYRQKRQDAVSVEK